MILTILRVQYSHCQSIFLSIASLELHQVFRNTVSSTDKISMVLIKALTVCNLHCGKWQESYNARHLSCNYSFWWCLLARYRYKGPQRHTMFYDSDWSLESIGKCVSAVCWLYFSTSNFPAKGMIGFGVVEELGLSVCSGYVCKLIWVCPRKFRCYTFNWIFHDDWSKHEDKSIAWVYRQDILVDASTQNRNYV